MDIHHLKVFVSVFRIGSFSKASEMLNLSQPTVSEHIKNLETELDCRLFDRVGRKVLPTRQAQIIYPRALRIIEEMQSLKADIQTDETLVAGELVIGASTIPGTYILPPLASDFKKKNPGVSFQIVIQDSKRISDLVRHHQMLIGVVGAVMDHAGVENIPFLEDELVLAAAPGVVPKDSIGIGDLTTIPFVRREEGSGTLKTAAEYLLKKNIHLRDLTVVGILGSNDSVKQALKAGLGASILSRVSIRDELEQGSLKEISVRGLRMPRHFYLVFHKKRSLPAPYRAFLFYLRSIKNR